MRRVRPARLVRRLLATGAWRPASAQLLLRDLRSTTRPVGSDEVHLRAAADWLCRAQDAAAGGGVTGRYFLQSGWSSAYPETTGYIIPTFLALAETLGEPDFHARAAAAVDFLLSLQLPDGAFPGGELSENRTAPSVFNTGQIIHGLLVWHAVSGDTRSGEAARRAARWLASIQEPDGSWIRSTYLGIPAAYHAHATCWLADAAIALDEPTVREAVRRHVTWCLAGYDADRGWIDRCGFTAADHRARRSVTHTFAYTLFGILHASQRIGMPEGVEAVRRVAQRAAELTLRRGALPGFVDVSWTGGPAFACLTGNVQMALVWRRLDELEPSPELVAAADLATDAVKAAQPLTSRDPGIRGGVPGSTPVWGPYIPFALPNWAAKFLIDALLVRAGHRQPGRMD